MLIFATSALRDRCLMALVVLLLGCSSTAGGPGELPTSILTPELRIGSLDDPATSLSVVGDVAVAEDGTIFVLQPQENLVRVFDDRGVPRPSIGQAGSGPGEFRQPMLFWIRGDSLVVIDISLGRRTIFLTDGTHVDDFGFQRAGQRLLAVGQFADGSLAVAPVILPGAIAGGDITHTPLLRVPQFGGPALTVVELETRNQIFAVVTDERRWFADQPFSDRPLFTITADGAAVVVLDRTAPTSAPAKFSLTRITPDGDTIWMHGYEVDPTPLPVSVVDSVVAERRSFLVRVPPRFAPARAERLVREALFTPAYYPPVSELVAGLDGTIWVRRTSDSAADLWMVLSGEGEHVASVQVHKGLTIYEATREYVWGVERDEVDVPYIVRYRVEDPSL